MITQLTMKGTINIVRVLYVVHIIKLFILSIILVMSLTNGLGFTEIPHGFILIVLVTVMLSDWVLVHPLEKCQEDFKDNTKEV